MTEQTDWLAGKQPSHMVLRIGRTEVFRSLRHYISGTKPRTSHTIDRLEKKGIDKRKRSTIFPDFQKTREGHRQSDEHWNRFKGNAGETSERERQVSWKQCIP